MKALILVGGFGTRLRPLTFTVSKPFVEFCNLPILCHQIQALASAGVTEVILAINHQPADMMSQLPSLEKKYNLKITCSVEDYPMGTAGPLRLAEDKIMKDNKEELLVVFNSDVICNYPLEKMIAYHKEHGKEGTIMVTKVEDPTKYGVIVSDDKNMITRFVEKPKQFVGDMINAGLYIFKTSMIKRIENRPTSIEQEIFPKMAAEGELYMMLLPGYWMDIGQPKDYMSGQTFFLSSLPELKPEALTKGDNIQGYCMIDESAEIDASAVIGPNVVIGPNCKVGPGCRIKNATMLEGSKVVAHSLVEHSIIGWRSTVGKWCRVVNLTVLGEDVNVKDETFLNGTIILPHKGVIGSHPEAGKIIM